jgi:hypothetical protein
MMDFVDLCNENGLLSRKLPARATLRDSDMRVKYLSE